jgi:hypothetical protein
MSLAGENAISIAFARLISGTLRRRRRLMLDDNQES